MQYLLLRLYGTCYNAIYPTPRSLKLSKISNAHLLFSSEPTYYSIPFHILSQNSNEILLTLLFFLGLLLMVEEEDTFVHCYNLHQWNAMQCYAMIFIVNLLTKVEKKRRVVWFGSFIRSFYKEKI